MTVILDGRSLTLEDLAAVAIGRERVEIAEPCLDPMRRSQEAVLRLVAEGRVVYGVTTGLGALASVRLEASDAMDLQRNLVLSHAAGVGEPLPAEAVRAMMALRANSLVQGLSGVRPVVVRTILDLLNADIVPVVPSQGSVGASGDLAPLAHVAMALLGEGTVACAGRVLFSGEAMRAAGIEPLTLVQKEGLALLNGTQMMSAVLGLALHGACGLLEWAVAAAAMSIDALRATVTAFDPRIQRVRPHPGQARVASALLRLLEGSAILESHRNCGKVQDAYSLRAVPQVLGAVLDTLDHVRTVLEREMNSVTDNPIIVDGEALSGGNFHGEPVALVSDFTAIALAEMGSLAERRIDRLVNPLVSSLPPFLARGKEGLNSGYMIWQYTAAALASENKSLAHPASVDTIPTSAFQEDHVSMGSIAARKAASILGNCRKIVAIELMLAARGIEHLFPLQTGHRLAPLLGRVQHRLDPMTGDRFFGDDFGRVLSLTEEPAGLEL